VFRNGEYGLLCQRRMVRSVTGSTVTLNDSVDQRANAITWLANASYLVEPVPEGENVVFALYTKPFHAGQYVWLTSGPSHGNEQRGEFMQIKSIQGPRIEFTRGATRNYPQPSIAVLSEAANVTVKNLHIAQPINPKMGSMHISHARDIRFENCTFDGFVGMGQTTDIDFVNCTLRNAIALNTTTRASIIGCLSHLNGIHTDEADAEVLIEDWMCLNVVPGEVAIRTGLDPGRMRIRNCIICHGGGIIVTAPNGSIEGLTLTGRNSDCYLRGRGLRVSDLRTSGNVVACDGDHQELRNVVCEHLNLGWINGGPSNGRAVDCISKYTMLHPSATPGGWIVT
jgi:hypothetical protein